MTIMIGLHLALWRSMTLNAAPLAWSMQHGCHSVDLVWKLGPAPAFCWHGLRSLTTLLIPTTTKYQVYPRPWLSATREARLRLFGRLALLSDRRCNIPRPQRRSYMVFFRVPPTRLCNTEKWAIFAAKRGDATYDLDADAHVSRNRPI